MINKVNVTVIRQFLGFYCLSMFMKRLTHDVLLNIFIIYNRFYPESISFTLFMINKVNVTLFRQFLGLYCVCKLIIRFTHDVFLISLLFRIVSNLNHIHLPLFMINKVNITLLRQFLG